MNIYLKTKNKVYEKVAVYNDRPIRSFEITAVNNDRYFLVLPSVNVNPGFSMNILYILFVPNF